MKRNWIRNVIGGLSFTTALFVFQACYGTPQDMYPDSRLEGQVKSRSSGLPIPGIKVSVAETGQYEFTDHSGEFSIYTEMNDTLTIRFEDVDSTQNGYFATADTILTGYEEEAYLDVLMDIN